MKMISEIKVSEKEIEVCKEILEIASDYDFEICEFIEQIAKTVPGVYNTYMNYRIKVD